jgi:hypothetical protein
VKNAIIYSNSNGSRIKKGSLASAIRTAFPFERFSDFTHVSGSLVCESDTDSRNINLMRAFAAGFVAACKEDP